IPRNHNGFTSIAEKLSYESLRVVEQMNSGRRTRIAFDRIQHSFGSFDKIKSDLPGEIRPRYDFFNPFFRIRVANAFEDGRRPDAPLLLRRVGRMREHAALIGKAVGAQMAAGNELLCDPWTFFGRLNGNRKLVAPGPNQRLGGKTRIGRL